MVESDNDHESVDEQDGKSAPEDRAENGPFDASEVNPVRPYIDLGAIKILPRDNLNLRMEVEEKSQRLVAVGLDYLTSTLQIQAFAAPRSRGLWHETREQINQKIRAQGGRVELRDGPFGPELLANIPAQSGGSNLTRFIGVDGPRWFLRGVIGGDAARDANAAKDVEDIFRSIVVVRGSVPMPPRDLIPLQMPNLAGAS